MKIPLMKVTRDLIRENISFFKDLKIRIYAEPYYNEPAPKLTKDLMDWFWCNIAHKACFFHEPLTSMKFLEIKINRALPNTPIHFNVFIDSILMYSLNVSDHEIAQDVRLKNLYNKIKEERVRKNHFGTFLNLCRIQIEKNTINNNPDFNQLGFFNQNNES